MNHRFRILISVTLLIFTAVIMNACGGEAPGLTGTAPDSASLQVATQDIQQDTFPAVLPVDTVQPWEEVDGSGFIIPDGSQRGTSGISTSTEFMYGGQPWGSSANATDTGDTLVLDSTAGTSWGIYRIPLGGSNPGAVSIDANLLADAGSGLSEFWVGVANYGENKWDWYGPFSDSHVRVSTAPAGSLTSTAGSAFVAVVTHNGDMVDVVGIGVDPVSPADTDAPPQVKGLTVAPTDGALELNWNGVIAADLAGYQVYYRDAFFFDKHTNGVKSLANLQGSTSCMLPGTGKLFVRVAAVDLSGNEGSVSEIVFAEATAGTPPQLLVKADNTSILANDTVQLTATGADSYDWDLDGDGVFDVTGDATGSQSADTSNTGIIRPLVRGTSSGAAIAHSAVSLIVSGNSRPIAMGYADPSTDPAPLLVTFTGLANDFDGTIARVAWDFDGDKAYEWSSFTVENPPAEQYVAPGVYNAKYRVWDDKDAWDVDTVTVVVTDAANTAPTADLKSDVSNGDAPLTVAFDASDSTDGDGTIVEYAWDWDGDGGYDTFSDTPTLSHTFNSAGSPEVKVRVEDNSGARDTATLTITVNVPGNDLPTAAVTVDQNRPLTDQAVTFDASTSNDPDGTIVLYEWDFDGDGAWDSSGASATATYSYDVQFAYNAMVRVTDNAGAQATAVAEVFPTYGPWSMFGHDTMGRSRSPYDGPVNNNLRWSADLGNDVAYSCPVIGNDGTVYIGSWNSRFYAINPDGSEKWSYAVGNVIEGTAAIGGDGTVYAPCNNGIIHAFSPAGQLKWTFTAGGAVISAGAIGPDGTIYFGSYDDKFYALNPDGSERWSFTTDGDIFMTPAIGTDGTIYFGNSTGKLYALNQDGTLKSGSWPYASGGGTWSAPAIHQDGTVYFGSSDGKLHAVLPDGTSKGGNWPYNIGSIITSSPAIGRDGAIYFGGYDDVMYAVWPHGGTKWVNLFDAGDSLHSSPVLGDNGLVYIGCMDGKVYAFDQIDGTMWWSFNTGAPIWATPSLGADGTLYIGGDSNFLYALGPTP